MVGISAARAASGRPARRTGGGNHGSGRDDHHLLQMVLLRSMNQAIYTPENIGHFGLAYDVYTHFTSPIRRYPDLIVHRCLKAIIDGKPELYTKEQMLSACS